MWSLIWLELFRCLQTLVCILKKLKQFFCCVVVFFVQKLQTAGVNFVNCKAEQFLETPSSVLPICGFFFIGCIILKFDFKKIVEPAPNWVTLKNNSSKL